MAELIVEQRDFDPLGPTVRRTQVESGRAVHYIDEGEPSGIPLVFFGGAGTTVRAFGLLEFARSLRLQLGIRIVSVERNGLGQTAFDPGLGLAEHAADVWSLLERLGIHEASLIAISGGGPYCAHVALAAPGRVRSLHIACAFTSPDGPLPASLDLEAIAANPVSWWTYPPESVLHRVPGFADSCVEEATRGSFARGRDTPPDGLRQAFELASETPFPELASVRAPAFLYWGEADELVPRSHRERWLASLGDVREVRLYPDEGHDVQYRHWDQILTDVAFLGERVILCDQGRTLIVPAPDAAARLAAGATLGLCAWAGCV